MRTFAAHLIRRIPIPGRWRLVRPLTRGLKQHMHTVYVPHVGKMLLDTQSGLEAEIFVTGSHGDEMTIGQHLCKLLPNKDAVFVDVGANIGFHTLRVARFLAKGTGQVIAFEPISANYARTVHNVRLNGLSNVRVEALGLSDKDELLDVRRAHHSTGNWSIASDGMCPDRVTLVNFDNWLRLSNYERIDLVKMDIEGAEVQALRGMEHTLRRCRPTILIEINPMWLRRMDTSSDELISLLSDLDYNVFDATRTNLDRNTGRIVRVDPVRKKELNCIALPR